MGKYTDLALMQIAQNRKAQAELLARAEEERKLKAQQPGIGDYAKQLAATIGGRYLSNKLAEKATPWLDKEFGSITDSLPEWLGGKPSGASTSTSSPGWLERNFGFGESKPITVNPNSYNSYAGESLGPSTGGYGGYGGYEGTSPIDSSYFMPEEYGTLAPDVGAAGLPEGSSYLADQSVMDAFYNGAVGSEGLDSTVLAPDSMSSGGSLGPSTGDYGGAAALAGDYGGIGSSTGAYGGGMASGTAAPGGGVYAESGQLAGSGGESLYGGGPLSAAASLYGAYKLADDWGQSDWKSGAASGAMAGSYFGPWGTVIGAAIGAGLGSIHTGVTNKGTRARNSIRKFLADRGVSPEVGYLNMPDGSKFEMTSHGGGEGNYHIDTSTGDPLTTTAVGYSNPLAEIVTSGDPKYTSQLTGWYGNAALQGAKSEEDVISNVRYQYKQAGITKDEAYRAMDRLVNAGKITQEEYSAYTNALNRIYNE